MQPNAFKALSILHLALLCGLTIFILVALGVTLVEPVRTLDEPFQRALQVVCILLSLSCVIIGFNIFKRKIFIIRDSTAPADKRMEEYRAACVVWWAMIEGPGMLAGIGFLLSTNYAFFALAMAHVLILLAFMPRKANIILFLSLNSNEVTQLEGGSEQV